MKTSNRIILITVIFILLITVILFVGTWLFISYHNSGFVKSPAESSEIITKNFNLKDFNALNISGFYRLEISHNNAYKIELSAPGYLINHINIIKSENKLYVKQLYYADMLPVSAKVRIFMPELTGIKTRGNNKILFSGFTLKNLKFELFGSTKITGRDSTIKNLEIIGSGLVKTDLVSCSVKNANLNLSGTGIADLNMSGGVLSGTVNGTYKINYRGKVIRQDIITSGSVKVEKNDSL